MPILNDVLNGANAVTTPDSHIIDVNPPAQNNGPFISGISTANGGATDPQVLIYNAAVILVWALGIIAVLTIMYAGFKYLTAGGDSEKAETAKKMIIGSVIGLLLVIGSYLIFNTAIGTLNGANTNQTSQQILNQNY